MHAKWGVAVRCDLTLVLLSVKAGLRAGEIASLTWPMVVEPNREIGTSLELQDRVAKKGSGRVIPVHLELRAALVKLARLADVSQAWTIRKISYAQLKSMEEAERAWRVTF